MRNRLVGLSLALIGALGSVGQAHETKVYTIKHDPGGVVLDYIVRFRELDWLGQTVRVDGICASACTIVLHGKVIPKERVCLTRNALFGIHAVVNVTLSTHDKEITDWLHDGYPEEMKKWILENRGEDRELKLPVDMIFMPREILKGKYRFCK